MRHFTSSLIILLLTLEASLVQADDGPKFKKGVNTDAVRFVSNDSDDGKASTMIFDNFDVATDISRPGSPDVRMKTFTYVRTIEGSKDSCVEQHFRGFVSRHGAASATMIIHAGGKTTTVDLKKAVADAKKNTIELTPVRKGALKEADEEGFEVDDDGDDDDYFVAIATRVPKGRTLQTTIILLVDRVPDGDQIPEAFLTVDSIDMEVEVAPE